MASLVWIAALSLAIALGSRASSPEMTSVSEAMR
jgi:hypothetical protein